MALVTGMTTINVTDASSESVEFNNMLAGVTVDVTGAAERVPELRLFSLMLLISRLQTFIVAAANANDNVDLVATDIETINISSDTANQVDLSLAGISMTAAASRNTVNFTGANDMVVSHRR